MASSDTPSKQHLGHVAAGILTVVGLALALRLINLLSMPMFLDEAPFLDWGLEIWERRTREALFMTVQVDGRQPLFFWLAGAAAHLSPDPLLGGRIVSAVAGAASSIGIYLAGYWLYGRRAGFIAGVLYALAPFNLFYDRLALLDALFTSTGIWIFALSVFIARKARTNREAVVAGIGLGLALAAAAWTRTNSLLMLPFPVLCALFLVRQGTLRVSAAGFATGAGLTAALLSPLLLLTDPRLMWNKAAAFSESPGALMGMQLERWSGHALSYWSWFEAYLPAPLWILVLASVVWGLIRRRRITVLLLASWAVFTLPLLLVARQQFESRYVAPALFLLLLLLAALLADLYQLLQTRFERTSDRTLTSGFARLSPATWLGALIFVAVMAPSIWFDVRLMTQPETAGLPASDHRLFVTDWSSGYGFSEAVQLLKHRAEELTRDGQPVIVLGYYWWGHAHSGLKMYMRNMPDVHIYLDGHLLYNHEGFMPSWEAHRVPLLVLGNEGLEDLDAWERAVPEARRIGYFPKPGGLSSFRVYEVSVAGADGAGGLEATRP